MGVKFMAPWNMMTLFGTASGGATAPYDEDWLVDGRPGRPAKTGTSTPPWVVTGSGAKVVNCVVISNHTIDAGLTIAITGGVTVNLVSPAARKNGIPVNPWAMVVSPASTNTITVTVSGNAGPIFIGEVIAGTLTELVSGILMGSRIFYVASSELPDGKSSSLLGYSDDVVQRGIECTLIVNVADAAVLEQWWESTKGDTRPSVLIPFDDLNDAWVGHLTEFAMVTVEGLRQVTFIFIEYPRSLF